ncbi:tubulin/FtsZ family, GTPase domain protein [Leptotrichia hongkongensis]|uniref:Tubulin/FtsZ family, GTPase domain protein n=1 Tax=Leptotrichia hongkongensis TaxID=554406 RepID=A0A510L3R5_9FUSO|nr:cell division protein FtsZ [Leptotrichia hongkongensis]BBM58614.1 tubulin/FtsZ family, GTPase domain protein [Leptotrichia hongkongensis]
MEGVEIKVIGIGTVGNDVLNKMMKKEIAEVEFVGIDTNKGNLDKLNVESKILASENLSENVQSAFKNTDLVFILTEMSEKKNNEIACIVSEVAKTMGILTVVVVATSINSNGEAEEIKKLEEVSDTVIVLPLKKLMEADLSTTFGKLFEKRDEIFIKNVEFITNLIKKQGIVNLDFDDIKIMLGNSGEGVIVFGKGEGQNKVKLATEQIINSPFIKNLPKARKILLSITAGPDIGLTDLQEITMIINEKFGADQTNMLWGYIMDIDLEDKIEVEMLITDFSK